MHKEVGRYGDEEREKREKKNGKRRLIEAIIKGRMGKTKKMKGDASRDTIMLLAVAGRTELKKIILSL